MGNNGHATGIELKRCTDVFDEDKRFNPRYDETVTTSFDCDTIILAIGQTTDLTFLDGAIETRGAGIRVDDATLASNSKAQYFVFEEERMYTQRESELLQQYLQQHGKLPEGNDELADLF